MSNQKQGKALGAAETPPQNDLPALGEFLRQRMAEQDCSMRQLSRESGVCTASISRIINGKQPAQIYHLQAFSTALGIPMEQLLLAGGAIGTQPMNENVSFILETIQSILLHFDINIYTVVDEVEQQLKKYEGYAKTEEGKEMITSQFHRKVKSINGTGYMVDYLHEFYRLFLGETAGVQEKAVLGSVLLYFILSADIIPDYAFPLGFLDDTIAINLALKRLPHLFAQNSP